MADAALVRSPRTSTIYWLVEWLLVAPVYRGLLRGRSRGLQHVPVSYTHLRAHETLR